MLQTRYRPNFLAFLTVIDEAVLGRDTRGMDDVAALGGEGCCAAEGAQPLEVDLGPARSRRSKLDEAAYMAVFAAPVRRRVRVIAESEERLLRFKTNARPGGLARPVGNRPGAGRQRPRADTDHHHPTREGVGSGATSTSATGAPCTHSNARSAMSTR